MASVNRLPRVSGRSYRHEPGLRADGSFMNTPRPEGGTQRERRRARAWSVFQKVIEAREARERIELVVIRELCKSQNHEIAILQQVNAGLRSAVWQDAIRKMELLQETEPRCVMRGR